MKPTDTKNPDYYHRVVDCQWACPAHTDVPEYIRLIAQGRYTDAYMVNRESNVFPGILGRVCDRPCEPACRRGRVEDQKPVAICRLKRVAGDLKGELAERLPAIPEQKNGKHIACVGAGCASLTVANDLMPLGYEVTIFEQHHRAGGLMRTNIPAFRLPPPVLDEEIDMIVDMGVDLRLGTPVHSMQALLDAGYDAIFVGSGAPRGKNLELPGRYDSDRIHVGIEWLESVAFGHTQAVGERVVIVGGGNTAMDCCRTVLRLGAKEVKVLARKPWAYLKASDWELEGALEENVEILCNHSPSEYLIENGRLVGMRFEHLEWHEDADGKLRSTKLDDVVIEADDVILAVGQENAFAWIEPDCGVELGRWDVPVVDRETYQSTHPDVFFGGDAAFGPENIIWAVEHGHQAAISIHKHCHGEELRERLPYTMNLGSRKMGLHEWSYDNDYDPEARLSVPSMDLATRFTSLNVEAELGFTPQQAAAEAERCLNCDVQTVFDAPRCIECDACIDICPTDCLTITENVDDEETLRTRLSAPAENRDQPLFVSAPLKQTGRIMVKDEDQCIHCGLCAERCPTAAWDMQKSTLEIPYAADEAAATARLARRWRKA